MKKILLWLRIIRPQTLFASIVPVAIGLWTVHFSALPVVAAYPALVSCVTAVCAVALQVLSNLINDYYDFKQGADQKGRAGYRRALAEGEVSLSQMRIAVFISLGIALLCGAYLILIGGWVILLIGLTALLFAWLYTATSHSLSYLGIADIFVFLYYGVVASSGTAYLLTHAFLPEAFYAGAVCGLISMCVLMINNLRDREGDKSAGKKTIVVRLGKRGGEAVMLVEVLLMPLFAYLAFGLSPAILIIIAALVLFFFVRKAEGPQYNVCLLFTGLMNVLYLALSMLSF